MNPMDQSRRGRFQPLGGRGCLLLFALSLGAWTGCEGTSGGRRQGDPMLGFQPPSAPAPAPSDPGNAGAVASSGSIPPLPASYTTPGTVPVAGGETATPENVRDLRMTTDTAVPASPQGTAAARGSAPAITVGNPEPAPTGVIANATMPPASSVAGPAAPPPPPPASKGVNIQSYEDAQRYLKQHGVNWQRLSGDEGEWKFACGIPNPSNPRMNKTYQTSRAFPDDLSAIRAVIAEIEQASR